MEVLLPKTRGEFASESYWNAFFKERGANEAFEWYGSYSDLRPVLKRTLRKLRLDRDRELKLLIPGCGNSELSVKLQKDGFQDVTSIDFNATITEGMAARYPAMKWLVADVCNLKPIFSESFNFDVIVDKGTLDAIISDDSVESLERGTAFLSEADRMLAYGGIYAVVTLAQPFITNCLFDALTENDVGSGGLGSWKKVEIFSLPSTEAPSPFLPFLIVSTKRETNDVEKSASNCEPGGIVLHFDEEGRVLGDYDDATRLDMLNRSELHRFLRQAQLAHRHRYELSRLRPGRLLEEWLWMKNNSDSPRYSLLVVDVTLSPSEKQKQQARHCAVLLVPRGGETDYSYNSYEGLCKIGQDASTLRLVAVRLCPGHNYSSQEAIKNELAGALRQFAPHLAENGTPYPPAIVDESRIPIFSTVPDVGADEEALVQILTKGTLKETEGYIVYEGQEMSPNNDDIDRKAKDGLDLVKSRRLVFAQNPTLTQSEVRLVGIREGTAHLGVDSVTTKPKVASAKKKKKSKKKSRPINSPKPHVKWHFDHLRPTFNYQRNINYSELDVSTVAVAVLSPSFRSHRSMLAASSLAFLNPRHTIETGGGGLVLGLGGGGLPMAIRALVPHIPVAVCEIEKGLIEVAEEWFGFEQGPMLQAVVSEAIAFTEACANMNLNKPEASNEVAQILPSPPFTPPYSAIFVDVDSKDMSVGMSCPPLEFVSTSSLTTFHSLLWDDGGVLLINVAARNASLCSASVDATIHVFGSEFVRTLHIGEGELNMVIVAWKGQETSTTPFHTTQDIEEKLMSTGIEAGMTTEEAQDLSRILQRLK